jgi:hypothetical protein
MTLLHTIQFTHKPSVRPSGVHSHEWSEPRHFSRQVKGGRLRPRPRTIREITPSLSLDSTVLRLCVLEYVCRTVQGSPLKPPNSTPRPRSVASIQRSSLLPYWPDPMRTIVNSPPNVIATPSASLSVLKTYADHTTIASLPAELCGASSQSRWHNNLRAASAIARFVPDFHTRERRLDSTQTSPSLTPSRRRKQTSVERVHSRERCWGLTVDNLRQHVRRRLTTKAVGESSHRWRGWWVSMQTSHGSITDIQIDSILSDIDSSVIINCRDLNNDRFYWCYPSTSSADRRAEFGRRAHCIKLLFSLQPDIRLLFSIRRSLWRNVII